LRTKAKLKKNLNDSILKKAYDYKLNIRNEREAMKTNLLIKKSPMHGLNAPEYRRGTHDYIETPHFHDKYGFKN